MDSQHEYKYCVVEFIGEFDQIGRPQIDLVPYNWIIKHPDDSTACYFPPAEALKFVEIMTKNNRAYDVTWKTYPVNILKSACKFQLFTFFILICPQRSASIITFLTVIV